MFIGNIVKVVWLKHQPEVAMFDLEVEL